MYYPYTFQHGIVDLAISLERSHQLWNSVRQGIAPVELPRVPRLSVRFCKLVHDRSLRDLWYTGSEQ